MSHQMNRTAMEEIVFRELTEYDLHKNEWYTIEQILNCLDQK